MSNEEQNPYDIYEKATIGFQKLKAGPGDIVVITFPENIDPRQMEAAALMFGERSKEMGIHIICTSQGITANDLSEAELNACGYYKK
jgi:hypothetical protein